MHGCCEYMGHAQHRHRACSAPFPGRDTANKYDVDSSIFGLSLNPFPTTAFIGHDYESREFTMAAFLRLPTIVALAAVATFQLTDAQSAGSTQTGFMPELGCGSSLNPRRGSL